MQRVIAGLFESTSYPDRNLTMVLIQGWPADSPMFNDLKIARGERLQPADKGKQCVMVSARLAETLGTKTGGKINVLGKQFTIVGEFESFSVYENNSIVFLLGDLQQLVGLPGKVTGFQIIAADSRGQGGGSQADLREDQGTPRRQGATPRLGGRPTREYVESVPQIRMAKAMAWITSAIALIIGAVGMLNTMIMSVFERTREIGILRAIGWRKWRMVRMILIESVLLSLVGGVVGACGAVLLTRWLSTHRSRRVPGRHRVPWRSSARDSLIAFLVGLIGGGLSGLSRRQPRADGGPPP